MDDLDDFILYNAIENDREENNREEECEEEEMSHHSAGRDGRMVEKASKQENLCPKYILFPNSSFILHELCNFAAIFVHIMCIISI